MSTGQFNCEVMGQENVVGCAIAVGNIFCYLVPNQNYELTLVTCNIGKFLNTNQVNNLKECNYWHAKNFSKQSTQFAPAAAILGKRLYFFWVDQSSGNLFSSVAEWNVNKISYLTTPVKLTYKGSKLSQSCDLAANSSPDGSQIILHTFDHSSVNLRAYYFDPANLNKQNFTWDTTSYEVIDSAYTTANLSSEYFHINAVRFTEERSGDFIAASFFPDDGTHVAAALVYRIQSDGSVDTSTNETYLPVPSLTDIHKGFRMAVGPRQKVFGMYCDDNSNLCFRTLFPMETARPTALKWSKAGYWNQDQKSTSNVVPALSFLGQSGNIVMYGEGGESHGGHDIQAQAALNESAKPIPSTAGRANLVTNTKLAPFFWVCRVVFSRPGYWEQACSGLLLPHPQSGACLFVTAAHCLSWNKHNGWATQAQITPGANTSNSSPPYPTATIDLTKGTTAMQLRAEWLIANQAKVPKYRHQNPYYDYAAIYVSPAQASDWDLGGFQPMAIQSMQKNQIGAWTGYPYKGPYNPGDMYTERVTITPTDSNYFLKFKSNPTVGASGSPIYYQDANGFDVVGLITFAPLWFKFTSLLNSGGMAFQSSTVTDLQSWQTPLAPTDKITSLQMVVRTGTDWWAGTGNNTWVNVRGNNYGRTQGGEGNGQYGLYDMTGAMQGLSISDLSTTNFAIQSNASFFYDNWEIESAAVFANGRLLNAQNFNRWLKSNSQAVTGVLNP